MDPRLSSAPLASRDMDVSRFDTIVHGGVVVEPSGLRQAAVGIRGERIAAVAPDLDLTLAQDLIDASGKFVFPGIIDAHSHPVYADDMQAFSRQMGHGGVTTLVPFIGAPPATRHGDVIATVDQFVANANSTSYLDFAVHATFLDSDDVGRAVPALVERGVRSAKMFMCFSGRGMMIEDRRMLAAMAALAEGGCVAVVHAENDAIVSFLENQFQTRGWHTAQFYPPSRPPIAEAEGVFRALSLAEVAACPIYLVHLSARESLDVVRWFRSRASTPIFAETCTHYLVLTEEELERQGGLVKISPPLRRPEDVNALWQAIVDGTIDVVATDGSGQTRARKAEGGDNIFSVPFGIAGAQFMVPLVYSEGVNLGRVALPDLARIWCERPARIFGLYPRKGSLQVGADADLMILDPRRSMRVGVAMQRGNSDYCPYEGREVMGAPVLTMQRGRIVLKDGQLHVDPGRGRYLPAEALAPWPSQPPTIA